MGKSGSLKRVCCKRKKNYRKSTRINREIPERIDHPLLTETRECLKEREGNAFQLKFRRVLT